MAKVDTVLKGLEEWNAKWFQELITKLKGELEHPVEHKVKSLQPTVEDVRTSQDEFELGRRVRFADAPLKPIIKQASTLDELLKRIAKHLIAEYAPADSLVITPGKLHAYYSRYKLQGETLPFLLMQSGIFDTRYSHSLRALSALYLDLGCEHHIIPPTPGERPRVPALTMAGFREWTTLLMRANPERETARLGLVATNLGLDGAKPRAVSTRCHARACEVLASALAEWQRVAGERRGDEQGKPRGRGYAYHRER